MLVGRSMIRSQELTECVEVDSASNLPALIRRRLCERLFNVRLMGNDVRSLYVEALVEEALKPDWKYVGADWRGWDFENVTTGIRLEVKQSASCQPWTKEQGKRSSGSFDIAERTGHYIGDQWVPERGRPAQWYLLAWNGIADLDVADDRDPNQWEWLLIPTARLPVGQRSIGLQRARALALTACRFAELGQAVATSTSG